MNIGIFSDSYSSINVGPGNDHLGLSWVDHLSLTHNVTNFGRVGAAFSWIYQLFLENKDKFDLCIVIVTAPDRIYIKALDSESNKHVGHFFNQSLFRQQFKESTNDLNTLRILDSIEIWHDHWRDHSFELHLHHLMVKNVMSYDNVLVIPGFPNSIENYSEPYQNLTDIQFWELLTVLGETNPEILSASMVCKRKCHLTEENNQVLFFLILKAIDNHEKVLNLDIKYFKKPTKSIDYYAKM